MKNPREVLWIGLVVLIISFLSGSVLGVKGTICKWELDDDDGTTEWNCEDEDDDDGLSTFSLVGLIIAVIAVLIAVPIIICFCCSWCCFNKKESAPKTKTVYVVATPPNNPDFNQNETDTKIPMDNMSRNQLPRYSNGNVSGREGPLQGPSAPYPMMASDEDQDGFYRLGYSNQPPPPYPFPMPVYDEQNPYHGYDSSYRNSSVSNVLPELKEPDHKPTERATNIMGSKNSF